ncbi:Beta-1 [Blattella germanica]|nr:Beta-1 [Blattella germanica]
MINRRTGENLSENNKKMGIRFISRIKIKYLIFGGAALFLLEFFGAFTHMFETDYYTDFSYPLEGDIHKYVLQIRNMEVPDVAPINSYNYTYISSCNKKCKESDYSGQLRLVYIVKSAVKNFDRRLAIRNSWGFEKRFSDVPIRTVFLLGVIPGDLEIQDRVDKEQRKYGDIVQSDFIDSYFNNTIKTMMGFKWAVTFCPNSKFYMFSDDDMYVSTKNVLRFIRNPTQYPEYLETPVVALKRVKRIKRSITEDLDQNKTENFFMSRTQPPLSPQSRKLKQFVDFELPDNVRLFAGYVFVSAPHRHRTSKWHVSLAEYPFHMWPPYVTAGAYVLSHEALFDMYYASFYTKHFRFDDIYLGLIAKKADIEPYHCSQFHFYKKEYNVFSYRYVVASHGYDDPSELLKVWNEQKSAGNA